MKTVPLQSISDNNTTKINLSYMSARQLVVGIVCVCVCVCAFVHVCVLACVCYAYNYAMAEVICATFYMLKDVHLFLLVTKDGCP